MAELNIENRTIYCCDNLDILRGINSDCIDLIYLDPPFNKRKTFSAATGSSAEGAAFTDIFREEDVKEEWLDDIRAEHYTLHNLLRAVNGIEVKSSYNFCYLAYMSVRLIECRRILQDRGSLYLHCDPAMSHYLKLVLDCIFGESNFQNEIIWGYKSGGASKFRFARKHDIIFFYSKQAKPAFNSPKYRRYLLRDQETGKEIGRDPRKDKVQYHTDNIGTYRLNIQRDVWDDIGIISPNSKIERTGYPTQKPLKLLRRIITASSNKGDIVLDPFCGCATTPIAAELEERDWVGIDVSHKAFYLVKQRLDREVPADLIRAEPNFETSPPKRSDFGVSHAEEKFVYIISNEQYPDEYKVGIASNTKSRLNQYQTSDPNRGYKIEFEFKTHKYREVEKAIHEKYENKHEWIRGDKADIIKDIKELAVTIKDIKELAV